MKFENQIESVKNFFVRLGRRNLIIICAVLLIGVAATVNVIYFTKDDTTDAGAELPGDGNVNAGAEQSEESYFTASQISRQRARDEALEVLQNVIDNESADSEAKAVAIADIAKMASDMEAEANVESLIMAKGFAQCVAVIGGDSINVVVDVDSTLNASQIAQINTIVFEQTGITPDKTVIIEK
jgi:stage III sporulation protein AH